MKLIKRFLCRRFSKDEYKQLLEILASENKLLLKRPQYIIGNSMMVGLVFYFMARAFGPETFRWPKMVDVTGVVVAALVGVLVIWAIFRLFKVKPVFTKFFMTFWFIWMVAFGLLTTAQSPSTTKWDYLAYAFVTLIGWLCCCNSIKEHLCEKIFFSQKKSESQTVN